MGGGTTHRIQWTSTGVGEVQIQVLLNTGQYSRVNFPLYIIPNKGRYYDWTIPTDNPDLINSHSRIKITEYLGEAMAESNEFTIYIGPQ